MEKEIINIVNQIIREDFKNELEIYNYEKEDAISAIKQEKNITSLVDEEFVNGLGIPEPGLLAWIPILYSSFVITERFRGLLKVGTLESVRKDFEKELVKNGLEEKKARQISKKHFKKIYKVIQHKIID